MNEETHSLMRFFHIENSLGRLQIAKQSLFMTAWQYTSRRFNKCADSNYVHISLGTIKGWWKRLHRTMQQRSQLRYIYYRLAK